MRHSPSLLKKTSRARQPKPRVVRDRCSDYNAFGRDPEGLIAYIAALLWGRDYVPAYPVQQFVGAIEPPKYGPPAPYQIDCLPPGWKPTPSRFELEFGEPPVYDPEFYPPPPKRFKRGNLGMFRHVKRFRKHGT